MQGLGLIIGVAFMDVKKAKILASIVLMTSMLSGGFFIHVRRKLPNDPYDFSQIQMHKTIITSTKT